MNLQELKFNSISSTRKGKERHQNNLWMSLLYYSTAFQSAGLLHQYIYAKLNREVKEEDTL